MSFAGTPLGQGRRLDHHTFLGKPSSSSARPPSPARLIPTSYSYSANSSRSSPDKALSREPSDQREDNDYSRFGRNNNTNTRTNSAPDISNKPGAPKIFTSPPKHPENWAVKNTSVNIASAFTQAILGDMSQTNPNNASWASSSRTVTSQVPRSTSVEYVSQAEAASNRRLAPPPSRAARGKPLSRATNSESERSATYTRGKSPLEHLSTALSSATFYVRKQAEREQTGNDPSYDYSAEEREYQAANASNGSNGSRAHRRNRMSVDNKAYKPPAESELESSEDDSDDKSKRRRKKKKDSASGLLSLPVISQDKRRRRKKRIETSAGAEEEEESGSDDNSVQQNQRGPVPRGGSVASRQHSIPPDYSLEDMSADSANQGLTSIPEDELEEVGESSLEEEIPSTTTAGSFLSATAGKLVYGFYVALRGCLQFLSYLFWLVGLLLGSVAEVPRIIGGGNVGRGIASILGGFVLLWAVYAAARNPSSLKSLVPSLPTFGGNDVYEAPGVPAVDISEFNDRLLKIERALQQLASTTEQTKSKTETEGRVNADLSAKINALESRLSSAGRHAEEANEQTKAVTDQAVRTLQRELEVLHAQLKQMPKGSGDGVGSDVEAREQLKMLESRVGSVEGEVKEALELGKQSVKPSNSWINRGKNQVTIKSSDGQDVTSLIGYLVDTAVSAHGKDVLAKADFALHSGGARIIPSLTSPTFEMKPQGIRANIVGLLSGQGYAIGRPPITALHHELHNGHCWPFAGSEGQLGVALAAPTYISEITIDHVAKETSFDMRSAPREMEVWAMVEGEDNIQKVHQWIESQKESETLPSPYPTSLPNTAQYIKIAEFSYDAHSEQNVQTFPIFEEIKELQVDFGIVVLRVKSNWGRDDFTCLYRLRVHGERMGEDLAPLPHPELDEEVVA